MCLEQTEMVPNLQGRALGCRKTLELAGPAFMKWGQWASTRADIFPPDMCNELARLQSSAPAHPYRRTAAVVKSALGQPISVLFDRYVRGASAVGAALTPDSSCNICPHGAVRRADVLRDAILTGLYCLSRSAVSAKSQSPVAALGRSTVRG